MLGIRPIIIRSFSSTSKVLHQHVCIVGSGPAGYYSAQQILKSHPSVQVDIYEKLPVPFGLARYGVAPDHPEVKNCINTFTQTSSSDRLAFFGNVNVGSDVSLNQLKDNYDAIVLSYGASEDRPLNIPGEECKDVLSARQFVGWYNGLPENADLQVNLDVDHAVIVGQGNVAVDVARILLSPIDELRKTDIPEPVLEHLSLSKIKHVTLVGRRGPEHVAFTIKELREMVKLQDCRPNLNPADYQHLPELIPNLPRPRKRLLELLAKTGLGAHSQAEKEWSLRFLLSPAQVVTSPNGTNIESLICKKNRLEGEGFNQWAVSTDDKEQVDCGLIMRSIGYKSVQIDPDLPFDKKMGIITNKSGRVIGHPGLYVSGWVGTGPVGVILSTMTSGFTTGKHVVEDLDQGAAGIMKNKEGSNGIKQILKEKGIQIVTFSDWCQLDDHEKSLGKDLKKPREKITSIEKMLEIINRG